MSARRVLLIGGTGVFGRRLANHLAAFDGLDLIVTSRDADKARRVAEEIAVAAGRKVAGLGLDHRENLAARLAEVAPWLVVDASGPFQGAGYDVPSAALEAGAHYIDLADARDYILRFRSALDDLARSRGLIALTGASSTPALSAAAVAELVNGWRRIDTIDIAITPGGRSEVGAAVILAILTYAGRPVPVWRDGELQQIDGWCEGQDIQMPDLGRRYAATVETVDAEWLGPTFGVTSRVAFRAGLESTLEQRGLMLLARARRSGLIGGLDALVPALLAARRITRWTTGDRGGMLVSVRGLDADGGLRTSHWSLLAVADDGPQVPTLAAAAALRAILDGRLEPGARPAAGAMTLTEIEREMRPYSITTRIESLLHGPSLFATALGEAAFAALPAPLRDFHGSAGASVWRGRAAVENGRHLIARLVRRILGLPDAGEDVPLTVTVERGEQGTVPAEIWTRNFAGQRFTSRLHVEDGTDLYETFGPVSFQLGHAARDSMLLLPIVSASVWRLPLPRFIRPRADAREFGDTDGRFRFDVRLTLPFVGLLVRYSGWLAPAAR